MQLMNMSGILCVVFAVSVFADQGLPEKKHRSSESEKGYKVSDIQKGWAFGDDPNATPQEESVRVQPVKGKCDTICLLTKILEVGERQLKEQTKIREILEEQYDPKPKIITRADGSQCIANSSADCFDFPLIAEAKRIPVLANSLKNPQDQQAVMEWKKWYAVYLNHNFDIGKSWEYDAAQNGSNSFQTDFQRDGYDSAKGYFHVAKEQHNTRLLNAFGSRGLSVKILLGKTQELDIYAMDQIAMFAKKHPSLPIELVFYNRESAEIFSGASHSIDFIGSAFSQANVVKRVSNAASDFPESVQTTPTYSASFKDGKNDKSKIIKSGKVEAGDLANRVVEWMIFEKIIDPAKLSDGRIWGDIEGFGEKYIKETYGKDLKVGKKR